MCARRAIILLARWRVQDARNAFIAVNGQIRPVHNSPFCEEHQPKDENERPLYKKCTKCKHFHEKHLFMPDVESCVYCCLTTPSHRQNGVVHMHTLLADEVLRSMTPVPDIVGRWMNESCAVKSDGVSVQVPLNCDYGMCSGMR